MPIKRSKRLLFSKLPFALASRKFKNKKTQPALLLKVANTFSHMDRMETINKIETDFKNFIVCLLFVYY